jgi:hypothetical protein
MALAEEMAHRDVFKEIQAELGFVPEFFKYIPKRTLRDQLSG